MEQTLALAFDGQQGGWIGGSGSQEEIPLSPHPYGHEELQQWGSGGSSCAAAAADVLPHPLQASYLLDPAFDWPGSLLQPQDQQAPQEQDSQHLAQPQFIGMSANPLFKGCAVPLAPPFASPAAACYLWGAHTPGKGLLLETAAAAAAAAEGGPDALVPHLGRLASVPAPATGPAAGLLYTLSANGSSTSRGASPTHCLHDRAAGSCHSSPHPGPGPTLGSMLTPRHGSMPPVVLPAASYLGLDPFDFDFDQQRQQQEELEALLGRELQARHQAEVDRVELEGELLLQGEALQRAEQQVEHLKATKHALQAENAALQEALMEAAADRMDMEQRLVQALSLAKAAASPLDLALQAPSPPTAHPTTSTLRSSSRGLSLLSSSSITGEAGIPPYSPALGCAAAAQAAPAASALAPSPARAAATLRLQATLRAASASSQGLPRTPLGRSGICSKGMALGLKAVSSMSKLGAPGLEALGLRSSDVTRTCDQSTPPCSPAVPPMMPVGRRESSMARQLVDKSLQIALLRERLDVALHELKASEALNGQLIARVDELVREVHELKGGWLQQLQQRATRSLVPRRTVE